MADKIRRNAWLDAEVEIAKANIAVKTYEYDVANGRYQVIVNAQIEGGVGGKWNFSIVGSNIQMVMTPETSWENTLLVGNCNVTGGKLKLKVDEIPEHPNRIVLWYRRIW